MNGFAYLASLGFRRASLLPAWLAPALQALDRRLAGSAWLLGLRALVAWRRAASA